MKMPFSTGDIIVAQNPFALYETYPLTASGESFNVDGPGSPVALGRPRTPIVYLRSLSRRQDGRQGAGAQGRGQQRTLVPSMANTHSRTRSTVTLGTLARTGRNELSRRTRPSFRSSKLGQFRDGDSIFSPMTQNNGGLWELENTASLRRQSPYSSTITVLICLLVGPSTLFRSKAKSRKNYSLFSGSETTSARG